MSPPSYPTGPCALGSNCQFKQLELRPAHKCSKCGQVLHVVCAIMDPKDDSIHCKVDCSIQKTPTSSSKDQQQCIPVSSIKATTPKKKPPMFCKSCGKNDHNRRTSKLCKYYISKKKTTSTPSHDPNLKHCVTFNFNHFSLPNIANFDEATRRHEA